MLHPIRLPLRAARAVSLFLLAGLAPLAVAQDEPERDGRWLYQRHCSGCHNDNGDGKGPTITALGTSARDFQQGGFAFGDSREQLFKTLTSGIPGRSPMPSFAGVMDEAERWLVVDYVRTLMPPRKDETPKDTVMVVTDRPLQARGKLPPFAEGARETTRGWLAGDPSGMTFQYDLDTVALLGVRLGAFADREDWGARGGGYLRPLGAPIHRRKDDLLAWPVKLGASDIEPTPFRRVLRSTWIRAGRPGLTYDIVDNAGIARCRIEESLRSEGLSVGAGFTRRWEVRLLEGATACSIAVADAHEQAWRANARVPRPGQPPRKPGWWTCDLGEDGVEWVLARSGRELGVVPGERALVFSVFARPGESAVLEASLVRAGLFDPQLGERLAEELGQ